MYLVARELPVASTDADARREFELEFRDVSRSAFLLARHLGRDTDAARDVVQEAALRAWRYRSSRAGDFRPWFLAIVYRQCRARCPTGCRCLERGTGRRRIRSSRPWTRSYWPLCAL